MIEEGHRVELEELLAHLANAHACQAGERFVRAIAEELIAKEQKRVNAIKVPDHAVPQVVQVDYGAKLVEPTNWVRLMRLHAEHHVRGEHAGLDDQGFDTLHPRELSEIVAQLDSQEVTS